MNVVVCQDESRTLSFRGRLSDYDVLLRWMTDKCIPLVREITFHNAEVRPAPPR